jgi:hypothetical protein
MGVNTEFGVILTDICYNGTLMNRPFYAAAMHHPFKPLNWPSPGVLCTLLIILI